MLKYVPRDDLKIAAEDIEPDSLSSQLRDQFELRPGDKRSRGAGYVAGDDFDWNASQCRGDTGPDGRIIINFSADQCRQAHGGTHPNELCLKSFFLHETALLPHGKRTIGSNELRESNSDLIGSVSGRRENPNGDQCRKNFVHK